VPSPTPLPPPVTRAVFPESGFIWLIKDGVEGVEGIFAEDGGVVKAFVLIEGGEGVEFGSGEGEIEEVEILAKMVRRLGFGDGNGAALHGPAEGDLSGGFSVGRGNFFDDGIGEEALGFGRHAQGEVGVGPEGGKGGDGDVFFRAIAEEVFLAKIRVHFDLKNGRLDARVGKDLAEHGGAEIGDSDSFGEAGIDEFFHGAPGVGVGNLNGAHGIGSGGPTGRIHRVEGDEFEGDGEVDEVEVELREAEVGEGPFAGGADVLGFVVGVPELACDPEVVAGAKSGLKGAGDAFADKFFIAVVGSAVEMAVARFDGLVDDPRGEFIWNFPSAKAGRREGGAIGKEVSRHVGKRLGNEVCFTP